MKFLHHINVAFYIATLIAYLGYEVTIGLIFQFFFGIFQLIYFFICLKTFKNEIVRKHLRTYFASVGITFMIYVLLIVSQSFSKTIALIFVMILPMLIASYFVCVTYLIQKQ